jgi:hypothetical protein
MEYKEALKKVQTEKQRDNKMLVRLDYSTSLLLPYKDGLVLMQALANAELFEMRYGSPARIKEFDDQTLVSRVISPKQYENYKISALLNIPVDKLEEETA